MCKSQQHVQSFIAVEIIFKDPRSSSFSFIDKCNVKISCDNANGFECYQFFHIKYFKIMLRL